MKKSAVLTMAGWEMGKIDNDLFELQITSAASESRAPSKTEEEFAQQYPLPKYPGLKQSTVKLIRVAMTSNQIDDLDLSDKFPPFVSELPACLETLFVTLSNNSLSDAGLEVIGAVIPGLPQDLVSLSVNLAENYVSSKGL